LVSAIGETLEELGLGPAGVDTAFGGEGDELRLLEIGQNRLLFGPANLCQVTTAASDAEPSEFHNGKTS
jgi:hypothetical protein